MPKIRRFEIPKAIWLNAQRIEVEFNDHLSHDEGNVGHASYRERKIRIQSNTPGYPRNQLEIEETFFHEMVHWILCFMGEDDLRENEKFVETFGALLHQGMVMADYGDE